MSEAKYYHVGDTGLIEGVSLGRITVVLVADHEAALAREAALQARLTVADQLADDLESALKRYAGLDSQKKVVTYDH
jgi:hypothetical protein